MKKSIQSSIVAALAVLFTACFSSGGGGESSTPVSNVSGTLVDDRVSGVNYTCAPSATSGITDTQGRFTCRAGDDTTFKIGNATLGTVAAQNGIITPYDFFPNNHTAAINIARLLQSIDSNTSDDIITPVTALVAAIPANPNFEADFVTFENTIETALVAVDGSFTLTSATDANTTMNTAITDEGEIVPAEGHNPVADAGTDQNVVLNATVTLNASSSSDADGDTLIYTWSWQERPAGSSASFSSTSEVSVTFVPDVQGAYVARLVVNDGVADSAADTVIVTANAIPVANAGVDQDVDTSTVVTLDGSASADPAGDTLTYTWVLSPPSGSTAALSDTAAAQPTFTPDLEGEYVATLIVDDGTDVSAADTVTVMATTPPSVANGYSPGWLEGRVLYTVILDTEDDDNDGSHYDWLLIAAKYENGKRYLDFSADDIYEDTVDTAANFTIEAGGVLKISELAPSTDWETSTITAVDSIKITATGSVSWGAPDETGYDFFEKADAQAYMDTLTVNHHYPITVDDIAGNQVIFSDGSIRKYYSNMTTSTESTDGIVTGTWSVENGVLIEDITYDLPNKSTIAIIFYVAPAVGTSANYYFTQTGNSSSGSLTIQSITPLADDIVMSNYFTVNEGVIAGKKFVIGGFDTSYYLNNMTYYRHFDDGNIVWSQTGTWSIVNGVIITDTTDFQGQSLSTWTTADLFEAAPNGAGNVSIKRYATTASGLLNDSIADNPPISGVISDITASPVDAGGVFDNNIPAYLISHDEVAGKVVEIDFTTHTETVTLNHNMTTSVVYQVSGSPAETFTGTWSVENGVIVVDITYDATESENRVIVFNNQANMGSSLTEYSTLAGDPVKSVGTITSIATIP